MKLVQFYERKELRVGYVEGEKVFDITFPAMQIKESKDVITQAVKENCPVASMIKKIRDKKGNCPVIPYDQIFNGQDQNYQAELPVFPTEVWGCGVTYENAAFFRDEDKGEKPSADGTHMGCYAKAHFAERPEIFFKGSVSRCVATNQNGGIRQDGDVTLCEPELCLVVNSKKEIIGYTIGDDLSAWNLERENPLYLPQCKVYKGGIVLGPAITLAETVKDPYNLQITCKITRQGKVIFDGEANTSGLKRKYEELVDYVARCQPAMDVLVIFTGTGMIIPLEAALQVGDEVVFEQAEIGKLVHGCEIVE